jgi:uncharacterized lipoprotein YajG
MKQVLVLLSVLTLAACGTASTEVKTDSTAVAVDSTTSVVDTVAVDSVK